MAVSNFFVFVCFVLSEKAMAPHSSTLAWKIPWTEEPGRLQSIDHKELDMTEHIPARAVKITIFLKVT